MANPKKVHPYMPNAVPETKAAMMRAIDVDDIDELFEQIPERFRLKEPLQLPDPIVEERALDRHLKEILSRNRSKTWLVKVNSNSLLARTNSSIFRFFFLRFPLFPMN